jgi:3'-phosphoadenosine 5'-phosphosulfate sulfotransferase (PAPS reductase)/FAD synthetase
MVWEGQYRTPDNTVCIPPLTGGTHSVASLQMVWKGQYRTPDNTVYTPLTGGTHSVASLQMVWEGQYRTPANTVYTLLTGGTHSVASLQMACEILSKKWQVYSECTVHTKSEQETVLLVFQQSTDKNWSYSSLFLWNILNSEIRISLKELTDLYCNRF